MKDIFLSWIQWSWKGTQSDLLMKNFPNQFKYFETWGILRALSSNDNAIWNYIKHTLDTWWLIKDDVTVAVFNVFLQTVEKWERLLIDWVLRKLYQTQKVCELMQNAGREFVVLHIDLSVENVEITPMDERLEECVRSVDENLYVVKMIQILRQLKLGLKLSIMKQNLD